MLYRERRLFPPGAAVTAVLQDTSRMDVPATELARATKTMDGGPPYRVVLQYDPARLTPQGRYTVRARIELEGQLLFISTQSTPAFGVRGSMDEPAHDPVEVLVQRTPPTSPEPSRSGSALVGTRWELRELGGKPPAEGAGGKRPYLQLSAEPTRVAGFSGCNQLSGSYTQSGGTLRFSKLALTRRACPQGMDVEQALARTLEQVRRFGLEEGVLSLLPEDGSVLARFEAAP